MNQDGKARPTYTACKRHFNLAHTRLKRLRLRYEGEYVEGQTQ